MTFNLHVITAVINLSEAAVRGAGGLECTRSTKRSATTWPSESVVGAQGKTDPSPELMVCALK